MKMFLLRENFQDLLDVLKQAGYECIGPRVRDGTIVFDTINNVTQLPTGVREKQTPGSYRLENTDSPRFFMWANGAEALKPLTFSPREVLWRAEWDEEGHLSFTEVMPESKAIAIIGVRGCDLSALHLQDHHFAYNTYADNYYNHRRRPLLLIGVDCSHPADTCFCVSTGDGPDATTGFDIALTELEDGFIVRTKSDKGKKIVEQLPITETRASDIKAATKQRQEAIQSQTRRLPSRHLKTALFANLEHPRWKEVGDRCLACGNCTSVCPTCFCHNEVELPNLEGTQSEHYRQWDSCFTLGHSYMHSFILRDSTQLRYRQWLTHKLGSWHDQYERSGCVGCGRCITWCPVGIDLTEEATAICKDYLEKSSNDQSSCSK